MKTDNILIDLDYKRNKKNFFKSKKFKLFVFHFVKLYYYLNKYLNVRITNIIVKESNKGFHIKLTINKDISYLFQILLQALFLSDISRELYNFCYLITGEFDCYNFFAVKKCVYSLDKKELIYQSEEKITKNSNKLLRKLLKYIKKIEEGGINVK